MELELGIDPDDTARLVRHPTVIAQKTARARTRPMRIVWHDSADRDLASEGLALAEHRAAWRLELLHPGQTSWPPGRPAPALAEGADPAAFARKLPAALVPAGAFDGRATALTLRGETGSVALTLLQGKLRAASDEHRASRVKLVGPDDAVQSLAIELAGDLRLSVPRESLAAEALAAAKGTAAPPRHTGAPELPTGLSVADAFAHVVGHLTDVILHLAPAAAAGQGGPEPVHQMRVAVRRLRSALKVFERAVQCPAVDAMAVKLKELGATLQPTRDWDVFATETGAAVAEAFPQDKRLLSLLGAAERRRRSCHAELRKSLSGAEFRRLGIDLACLAGGQDWLATPGPAEQTELATPLEEFARRVLHRRLKKLAAAGDDIASLEPAALHAVRLRAKRLRYAAEIFAPLYGGKSTSRFLRRLNALQQRLGTMNDGAVAAGLLAELANTGTSRPFATGLVLGFVGAHSDESRKAIGRAWKKFHRASPFWT